MLGPLVEVSKVGSIVGAFVATRTDNELREEINTLEETSEQQCFMGKIFFCLQFGESKHVSLKKDMSVFSVMLWTMTRLPRTT